MQSLFSVITYATFLEQGHTLLQATEDLTAELTAAEFEDARNGWEGALQELKRVAEMP